MDYLSRSYFNDLKPLLKKVESNTTNLTAPSDIFFIWIGSILDVSIGYIDIWKRSTDENITLWYDSQFFLAGSIKEVITSIYSIDDSSLNEVICAQNDFFKNIKLLMSKNKMTGDDAIIYFVKKSDRVLSCKLEKRLEEIKSKFALLKKETKTKDINNIKFLDDSYYNYYLMEVLLRNNLAAASDILRLSILFEYGGTYIDVDTLPPLDHIFQKTNDSFKEEEINKNIVDIFKSKLFIEKVKDKSITIEGLKSSTSKLYSALKEINTDLPNSLINDLYRKSDDEIYRIVEVKKANKNLFSMSMNKNSIGEFNNNIISAHQNSKSIKIVLREMKKRYEYILNSGFDLIGTSIKSVRKSEYYDRLRDYRLDSLDNDNYVTLITSGPSLLLEVMLGLSYDILKLDYNINQVGLSYALQVPYLGVGYSEQTMYTEDHIKSSWMESEFLEDSIL